MKSRIRTGTRSRGCRYNPGFSGTHPGRDAGFTLIEVAVVIGIIAVLATVLLGAKGFIESSRVTSAIRMVDTLRSGAQTFAKRECSGIAFMCPDSLGNVLALNEDALVSRSLIQRDIKTPWGDDFEIGPEPADPTYFRIGFCVPTMESCDGIKDVQVTKSRTATCTAATGGDCSGQVELEVVSR